MKTITKTIHLFLALGFISFVSSTQAATVVIDLTTAGVTGADLDNSTALSDLPFSVTVDEAVGISETPGLQLTVQSGSTTADNTMTTVNGASGSFGINSPGSGEEPTRFDVDFAESLTIAFNQPVTVTAVQLTSFSGNETFSVGGESFTDAQADGSNNYTFSGGGLAFTANQGIQMFAGGPALSSVGVLSLTIETQLVPEPSTVALLGLGGLALALLRRRQLS